MGPGAVRALTCGSASLRALRVTAPRQGGVARDGAGGLFTAHGLAVAADRPTTRTA